MFIAETATTKSLHFSAHQIQSRMDVRSPYSLSLEYTRTMMGFLVFEPAPVSILMIGLGGGSLAKFCYRYLPECRIWVIEINPNVIALRDQFLVPDNDERFVIVEGDGAEFVRASSEHYSIVMVDGYDARGIAPSLSSQGFYDNCLERLSNKGILVVNLDSGRQNHGPVIERIRRSFGEVLVVTDKHRESHVLFACRARMLETSRMLRCPVSFDSAAWESLQKGRQRILEELKKERW